MGRSTGYDRKRKWTGDGEKEGKPSKAPGGYAAADGDDGYPAPHVLESAEFSKYYTGLGLVPEGEWDAFIAALQTPLGVSFRISGRPDDPTALALRDYMEAQHVAQMTELTVRGVGALPPPYPIPWLPARLSWRFDVSRSTLRGKGNRRTEGDDTPAPPTEAEEESKKRLSAFHEFLTSEVDQGNMCRQEEVSMVPPELLRVEPGQRVLDMCAAPGSKTQQILEHLMAAAPGAAPASASDADGGFVIANDADYKRCHLLVHQAKRLNSPRLIVTNHDAQLLPTRMVAEDGSLTRLRFERILCDVPCSGDGTMRKSPDLWRRWTERLAWGVHRLQLNILLRGIELLLPGGRLVYSTCSMNPIEDEAVVAAALAKSNAPILRRNGTAAPCKARVSLASTEGLLPGLKRLPGVSAWGVYSAGEFHADLASLPEAARAKASETMFAPPPGAETDALRLDRCLRVLPHMQDTGGFFIAVLEKEAVAEEEEEDEAPAEAEAAEEDAAPVEDAAAAADAPEGESKAAPAEAALSTEEEHAKRLSGVCFKFQSGTCARGATSCRFAHVIDEAATAGAASASAATAAAATPAMAAHVKGVVHCSPRNKGRYDAIFSLQDDFVATVQSFFGMGDAFPADQLVARSAIGELGVGLGSRVRVATPNPGEKAHFHMARPGAQRPRRPGSPLRHRHAPLSLLSPRSEKGFLYRASEPTPSTTSTTPSPCPAAHPLSHRQVDRLPLCAAAEPPPGGPADETAAGQHGRARARALRRPRAALPLPPLAGRRPLPAALHGPTPGALRIHTRHAQAPLAADPPLVRPGGRGPGRRPRRRCRRLRGGSARPARGGQARPLCAAAAGCHVRAHAPRARFARATPQDERDELDAPPHRGALAGACSRASASQRGACAASRRPSWG